MSETLNIIVTGGTETVEIDTGAVQIVEIAADSELVVINDSGQKGDQGKNASLLFLEIEVEVEIPGPGWPIAINRATGKGRLARADNYPLSFVIGLSKDSCAAGFVVELERYAIRLTDWTAVAGTQFLSPGMPYFLGKTGGIGASPDLSAVAVATVGTAITQTTLDIEINNPTLL